MSARFSLADSAFLCAASALAVELCAAPLHGYANGVGVTIFGEELGELRRFVDGPARTEIEAIEAQARAVATGPLSHMAVDCVQTCRHLVAGTTGTPQGLAALCGFLTHVRRFNVQRAEELAA